MPCGPIKQEPRRKSSGLAVADVASRREDRRKFGCIGGDCWVMCGSFGRSIQYFVIP